MLYFPPILLSSCIVQFHVSALSLALTFFAKFSSKHSTTMTHTTNVMLIQVLYSWFQETNTQLGPRSILLRIHSSIGSELGTIETSIKCMNYRHKISARNAGTSGCGFE